MKKKGTFSQVNEETQDILVSIFDIDDKHKHPVFCRKMTGNERKDIKNNVHEKATRLLPNCSATRASVSCLQTGTRTRAYLRLWCWWSWKSWMSSCCEQPGLVQYAPAVMWVLLCWATPELCWFWTPAGSALHGHWNKNKTGDLLSVPPFTQLSVTDPKA